VPDSEYTLTLTSSLEQTRSSLRPQTS